MKRSHLVVVPALAAALGLVSAGTANAVDVVTTVTGTTVAGGTLALAGAGGSVALSGTPGSLTDAIGATVLTVSDLRGTNAGWAVTATYSDPDVGLPLGGQNVLVSGANVLPNVLGGLSASDVTTQDGPGAHGPDHHRHHRHRHRQRHHRAHRLAQGAPARHRPGHPGVRRQGHLHRGERPLGALGRLRGVLELVYTLLLVATFAFIGWFAVYVVYKLYQGQR